MGRIIELDCTRDEKGRITRVYSIGDNASESWTDALGRLKTAENGDASVDQTFSYDRAQHHVHYRHRSSWGLPLSSARVRQRPAKARAL